MIKTKILAILRLPAVRKLLIAMLIGAGATVGLTIDPEIADALSMVAVTVAESL